MEKRFYFGINEEVNELGIPAEFCVSSSPKAPEKDTESHEPEKVKQEKQLATAETGEQLDPIIRVQRDFFEQVHSFIDGLPALISFRPVLGGAAFGAFFQVVQNELASEGEVEDDNWRFFPIDEHNRERFNRERRMATRRANALEGMPEMVLLGAVSQFDAYMGKLLDCCIDKRPDIVSSSEKSFPAHKVLEYSDMEAFRDAVTAKTIEDFLRKSHQDQFDWLEKTFKVPLRKDLEVWPKFIEAFERRNLFAHSQGIVSETYRMKCLEAGCEDVPKVGTQLGANSSYISDTLQVFAEVGIKLAQVLGRKLSKNDSQLIEYETALNELSYNLITHGHYALAEKLLKFGMGCPKKPKDEISMMMEVNLANAHALQGQEECAQAVLSKRQWNTYSPEFAISVAAITKDVGTVCEILPRFYPRNYDANWCLRSWPVFAHVRDTEEFQVAYKKRFKCDYVPAFEVELDLVENS